MSDDFNKRLNEFDKLFAEYQKAKTEYNRLQAYDDNPRRVLRRRYSNQRALCPVCQQEFVKHHGLQIYCSTNCKDKAYRINSGKQKEAHWKRCVQCGAGFVAKHPSRLTCSERCRKDRKNFRERARRKRKSRSFHCDCVICGKSFLSKAAHAKYCSDDCRRSAHNTSYRQRYENNKIQSKPIAPDGNCHCVICGTHFHSKQKQAIYCSIQCKRQADNIRRRMKRHKSYNKKE